MALSLSCRIRRVSHASQPDIMASSIVPTLTQKSHWAYHACSGATTVTWIGGTGGICIHFAPLYASQLGRQDDQLDRYGRFVLFCRNMAKGDYLGEFEQIILLALLRLGAN